MSWDVYLSKGGVVCEVPMHEEGGTYAVGGSPHACLNVTYNYGAIYRRWFGDEGLRWLDGKTAEASLFLLNTAARALGTERSPDYWEATPGNAGLALSILAYWASICPPDAVFSVS